MIYYGKTLFGSGPKLTAVDFEIRTFLVARNHMIFGYKMKFCSITADSTI
jgi:hypothetical protein